MKTARPRDFERIASTFGRLAATGVISHAEARAGMRRMIAARGFPEAAEVTNTTIGLDCAWAVNRSIDAWTRARSLADRDVRKAVAGLLVGFAPPEEIEAAALSASLAHGSHTRHGFLPALTAVEVRRVINEEIGWWAKTQNRRRRHA